MPYIHPTQRTENVRRHPMTPGQLNFAITQLGVQFLIDNLRPGQEISYDERIAVHEAMMAAAAEWYRRVLAPYEDTKCERNGDVYPDWLVGQ